jgi:hypothetical protein
MFTKYFKLGKRIDPILQKYIQQSTNNIIREHYLSTNKYKKIINNNIISASYPPKIPTNFIILIIGFFTFCCFYKNSNMFSYSKYIDDAK